MISSSVSKVNPSHLADFAAFRGCSVVEGASVARIVPPAGPLGMPAFAKGYEAYHRTCAEYIQTAPTQTPPDRSAAAEILVREEPDDDEEEEEEDEGEDNGKEDDDDDTTDDGYSE